MALDPQRRAETLSLPEAARLAEHLARQTGIRFSPDQLRRLLHREGFSVQRPKHTMKGRRDEVAYTKAKEQLGWRPDYTGLEALRATIPS